MCCIYKASVCWRGKTYLPTLGDNRVWHLVTKGDSAHGCKRFAALSEEDSGGPIDAERAEFRTTDLTSSVDTDALIRCISEMIPDQTPSTQEPFVEVRIDKDTGKV